MAANGKIVVENGSTTRDDSRTIKVSQAKPILQIHKFSVSRAATTNRSRIAAVKPSSNADRKCIQMVQSDKSF